MVKTLLTILLVVPTLVVLGGLAILFLRNFFPDVVEPEHSGIVTAIVPISGAVERWSLDTGATIEFDLNHTQRAYQTGNPAVGNLVLAGSAYGGHWVMQIKAGRRDSPPDCFAVTLPAIDRSDAVEFSVDGGWHLLLPKTPTFRWKPYHSPLEDGTYLYGTSFCLNDRGAVTGQPPNQ
jgi:hypothetical protein